AFICVKGTAGGRTRGGRGVRGLGLRIAQLRTFHVRVKEFSRVGAGVPRGKLGEKNVARPRALVGNRPVSAPARGGHLRVFSLVEELIEEQVVTPFAV